MKIQGKKIEGKNTEICPIPRPGGDIIFIAQSVDMDEFTSLCPQPIPPKKIIKGGQKVDDVEHPSFIRKMRAYGEKRVAYMVIKSLEATPGLEWEKVNPSDASTWEEYTQELKESGFTDIEIGRIIDAVMTANCLNETRLEEARARFLLSRQQKDDDQSTPEEELVSTLSGEPLSV